MTPEDFTVVLNNKPLAHITPATARKESIPIHLISYYNKSVAHLNELAEEVRFAMRRHTELEQQINFINGEKP